MHHLLEIGFEHAGHWLLSGDKLVVELVRHAKQSNVLYAFVCDGNIKYVGKTTQTLAKRLGGYRNPGPTQATNERNHRLICEQLADGVAVDILVLPDNGLMHYGQFHLNLAAGLEDSIISTLRPPWNGAPTKVTIEAPDSSPPQTEFQFQLHTTYFNGGFFNVTVEHERYFGGDGEQIDIFCGQSNSPIIGSINRRANSNSTPRIMGGTLLKDWFQRDSSVAAKIHVAVQTPNEIRLKTTG